MPVYPNDLLTPAYLIGAVNDRPSKEAIKQQYMGLSLMPWLEVPERQVIYDIIFSENNLAGIYDPRGQAIPGDDVLFSSMIANLVDIKATRTLDSWTTQQIRDPGMPYVYKAGGSSNVVKGMQQRLKDKINTRVAWCNEAVDAQIEYFAMHALQGTITWPPLDANGNAITGLSRMPHWNYNVAMSVNMGLPAAQNQNVTTLTGYGGAAGGGVVWSTHATADPILDLETINEYMSKTLGITMRGGKVIMDSTVLRHLSRCTNILNWIAGANREQPGARQYADQGELRSLIKTRLGWDIVEYNAQWTYRTPSPGTKPTINRVNFLQEGKVIIIPPGETVGNMMTAPLESSPGGAWVYGKMGWSWQDVKPPYDIEVGVNCVAWPSFAHNVDWFVLTVL
jgi:hypothetical protein